MEISKIINKRNLLIAVLLVILGVSLRLIPHEANFAPIAAIALVSGALLGRKYALGILVLVMAISDAIIGSYGSMLFTWSAFLIIALYGSLLHSASFTKRIILGSLGSASIFFVISNLGTWLMSGMYAHTFAGIIRCYSMAVPFFRATLVSDFIYSAALFGVVYVVVSTYNHKPARQSRLVTA